MRARDLEALDYQRETCVGMNPVVSQSARCCVLCRSVRTRRAADPVAGKSHPVCSGIDPLALSCLPRPTCVVPATIAFAVQTEDRNGCYHRCNP